MNRDAAHRDPADDRLARLLDAPFLARVVPHMPAETLYQLIRSRGLDACSELAKDTQSEARIAAAASVNPIVASYFRAAGESSRSSSRPLSASMPLPSAAPHSSDFHATDAPESLEAVIELLTEAGVIPERPRALRDAPEGGPETPKLTRLRRLMAYVRDTDATAYLTRTRELAFLANTLVAGCSVQSRAFTPLEASDAAASICNLGLESWPSHGPSEGSDGEAARLIDHNLVTAFEVGWLVLHQDVSVFAAEQLISTLRQLRSVPCDIRHGLLALEHALVTELEAGTPWRARDAAEILAMLDTTVWVSVLGLLDECPILPVALSAVIEGRTTTISPTAFDFISTADQIGDVRLFIRKLPDLLSR